MKKQIKIFLSQGMHGRNDDEIVKEKNDISNLLLEYFDKIEGKGLDPNFFEHNEIVFISNYKEYQIPKTVKKDRIFYLSKALEKLSKCDYIYIPENFREYSGCYVEFWVANNYNISVLHEETIKHKLKKWRHRHTPYPLSR